MATITAGERGKINKKLKQMGFGGLDDRNLFSQIATIYRTHESFRGLLMSTLPSDRRIAYESLKPHLCFVAKPLDEYEREIKEKAEREQWDVYNGTDYPEPFKVGEIESPEYKLQKKAQEALTADREQEKAKGVLTVTCARCTKEQAFPGKTVVDARIAAREANWQLHPKQLCPDCSKVYAIH